MKKLFRAVILTARDLFDVALCVGAKFFIGVVMASPFMTPEEKRKEVFRLCRLVFRFDSNSYTLADMVEARDILKAVPEQHYAFAVARRLADY